ncbi:MAG: caspase family protein [Myxococcaceae bacterium]|nr:caspase family protein [Myxococcaceae bacterium]
MLSVTHRLARLALLAAIALGPAARAEERFALLIGANLGWENDKPLRHAQSDAERVAAVLVELGQFPRDRVTVLKDPDTAVARLKLKELSEAARRVDGPSLVFVYYSGHADSRVLHLRGEPLGFDELYQALRDTQATVRVGVFDACQAGAILSTKGGRPVAPFDVKVVDELTVRGLAVLTSSGADELSQETRALQGSVFTHHFVSGLRGAADGDQDGQVTLSESYRYAHQRTEVDTAATLVPQKPAFRYELKGQGDLVMSWPAKATARLVLPKGAGQRYVVVDEQERLVVAEGNTDAEHALAMALVPGKYVVKQVLADKLNVAAVTVKPGVELDVSTLTWAASPRSAGFVKGVELVVHPRTAFWFVAGAAVLTGTAWAIAGGRSLTLRNDYGALPRPLTADESRALTGWALASDISMGLTAALALGAIFTW